MQKIIIIVKLLLGEKYVEGRRKKKEGRKKNNAKFRCHYVCPRTHNVRAHLSTFAPNCEKSTWKERRRKRIMPNLVANTSDVTRTTCVRKHYVPTKIIFLLVRYKIKYTKIPL